MSTELWRKCLALLPVQDVYINRTVCKTFRTESEAVLRKHKKLWIAVDDRSNPCFLSKEDCFDPNHFVSDKDRMICQSPLSVESMERLASLFSDLEVLKINFVKVVMRRLRSGKPIKSYYTFRDLFPSLVCLMAVHSRLHDNNLKKASTDVSCKLKHLAGHEVIVTPKVRDSFPFLESLTSGYLEGNNYPSPSKRLVVGIRMNTVIGTNHPAVNDLPKTLEVCSGWIFFNEYQRQWNPTFPQLKEIGSYHLPVHGWPENLRGLTSFLLDNRMSVKSLYVELYDMRTDHEDLVNFSRSLSRLDSLTLIMSTPTTTFMKSLKDTLDSSHLNLKNFSIVLNGRDVEDIGLLDVLPDKISQLTFNHVDLHSWDLLLFVGGSKDRAPAIARNTLMKMVELLLGGNPLEFTFQGYDHPTTLMFEEMLKDLDSLKVERRDCLDVGNEKEIIVVRKRTPEMQN